MRREYSGILLALAIINTILHFIALSALIPLYGESRQKPQRLLIISVSICEAIQNILSIFHTPSDIFHLDGGHYVGIVVFALNSLLYVSLMYISLERLAKFIFNLNYPRYWNAEKTKYLLLATWLFVFLVALSIYFSGVGYNEEIFQVLQRTLDFTFTITVVTTYCVIIFRYKQSAESLKQKLKKSVFIVPSLLMTTFVVFFILPDVINTYEIHNIQTLPDLQFICHMLRRLVFLAHAVIYIALLKDVGQFLSIKVNIFLKKLEQCCCFCLPRVRNEETQNLELLTAAPVDIQCNKRLRRQ